MFKKGAVVKTLFKEKESIQILNILDLNINMEEYQIKSNYFKMSEENISQEFRLKNIDEIRYLWKIEKNELISKKHRMVCEVLNYTDHFLILAPAVTRCVSIFAFASLVDIPIEIMNSAVGLKHGAITLPIKKYNSTIHQRF